MERKHLVISGDLLLLALDALAVLDSRHGNPRTRNRRKLSERKLVSLVKRLFGKRILYFNVWLLFDAFYQIRLLLRAPHHQPPLPEMSFNILPVLQTIHSVGPGQRNDWHECDELFFTEFAKGRVSENDLKD